MDNEQKMIDGFNHGYTIAKYDSELYNAITKDPQPKGEYLKAFVSGGREFEMEKDAPSLNKHKDTVDNPDKNKGIDIER